MVHLVLALGAGEMIVHHDDDACFIPPSCSHSLFEATFSWAPPLFRMMIGRLVTLCVSNMLHFHLYVDRAPCFIDTQWENLSPLWQHFFHCKKNITKPPLTWPSVAEPRVLVQRWVSIKNIKAFSAPTAGGGWTDGTVKCDSVTL